MPSLLIIESHNTPRLNEEILKVSTIDFNADCLKHVDYVNKSQEEA